MARRRIFPLLRALEIVFLTAFTLLPSPTSAASCKRDYERTGICWGDGECAYGYVSRIEETCRERGTAELCSVSKNEDACYMNEDGICAWTGKKCVKMSGNSAGDGRGDFESGKPESGTGSSTQVKRCSAAKEEAECNNAVDDDCFWSGNKCQKMPGWVAREKERLEREGIGGEAPPAVEAPVKKVEQIEVGSKQWCLAAETKGDCDVKTGCIWDPGNGNNGRCRQEKVNGNGNNGKVSAPPVAEDPVEKEKFDVGSKQWCLEAESEGDCLEKKVCRWDPGNGNNSRCRQGNGNVNSDTVGTPPAVEAPVKKQLEVGSRQWCLEAEAEGTCQGKKGCRWDGGNGGKYRGRCRQDNGKGTNNDSNGNNNNEADAPSWQQELQQDMYDAGSWKKWCRQAETELACLQKGGEQATGLCQWDRSGNGNKGRCREDYSFNDSDEPEKRGRQREKEYTTGSKNWCMQAANENECSNEKQGLCRWDASKGLRGGGKCRRSNDAGDDANGSNNADSQQQQKYAVGSKDWCLQATTENECINSKDGLCRWDPDNDGLGGKCRRGGDTTNAADEPRKKDNIMRIIEPGTKEYCRRFQTQSECIQQYKDNWCVWDENKAERKACSIEEMGDCKQFDNMENCQASRGCEWRELNNNGMERDTPACLRRQDGR